MVFPTIPEELYINRHEVLLICIRIMFLKIMLLPRGPRMCLMGNLINVPADIEYGICSLPRYINSEGTFCVRIKRKLRYKAVYRRFNVRPEKVPSALKWLLQNSELYKKCPVVLDEDWLEKTICQLQNKDNQQEHHHSPHEEDISVCTQTSSTTWKSSQLKHEYERNKHCR